MILTRRHAVLLLAIAAWNVLSYANFSRNLWQSYAEGADRAAGYYVAHLVLIVVNLAVAVVLGRLGWRAWRAQVDEGRPTDPPAGGTSLVHQVSTD